MPDSYTVQLAIRDALRADQHLESLIGGQRIFDTIPRRSEFPYLITGSISSKAFGADTPARTHDLDFRVYSQQAGRKEVQVILEQAAVIIESMSPQHALDHFRHADVTRMETTRYLPINGWIGQISVRAVTDIPPAPHRFSTIHRGVT